MSLFTDRRAIKHVTDTRRRTPPAVFRPELQNMDHMKQERRGINGGKLETGIQIFFFFFDETLMID